MNQARIELIPAESSAEHKKSICESILRDLPGWFGIEEATQAYIAGGADKPMFVAADSDDIVGFLSLVHHNQYTSEIYVLGVKQALQRQGIETQLALSAERYLKEWKTEYYMVKTLGPSHPDEGYRRTRLFYEKVGFRPLVEIIELWGKDNPCLVMAKKI